MIEDGELFWSCQESGKTKMSLKISSCTVPARKVNAASWTDRCFNRLMGKQRSGSKLLNESRVVRITRSNASQISMPILE